MEKETERFEGYAVVEVFGHQKFAGYVSEQAIGGTSFVRVDVPELPATDGDPTIPGFTKLFGGAAIYSLSPVSEELARLVARKLRKRPVEIWAPELYPREARQAALPSGDDGEYIPCDDDDAYDDPLADE